MIRYKLLKDLPYIKAGAIVEMWDSGDMYFVGKPTLPRLVKKDIENFSLWFEEVAEPQWVYFIDMFGDGVKRIWFDDIKVLSKKLKAIGNYFETKAEAEKYLAYLKAKEVIKEDANGFKADWTDEKQDKFHGQWDYFVDKLYAQVDWKLRDNVIYFESLKALKESFKKHPKEWKTYLTYEQ